MSKRLLSFTSQLYTDRVMKQQELTWKKFVDWHSDLEICPVKYDREVFSPVKWVNVNAGQVLSNVEYLDLTVNKPKTLLVFGDFSFSVIKPPKIIFIFAFAASVLSASNVLNEFDILFVSHFF